MEITKVDLRGLEPGKPGWDDARAAVTASMVAHGCVRVQDGVFDRDLRQALFRRVLPDLFGLPVEAKRRNVFTDVKYGGYIGQIPDMAYESMRLQDVTDAVPIGDFANLLWLQGNRAFCDTIGEFAKKGMKLEQTVTKMVLEGLGVRSKRAIASHQDQLGYHLRMSYYGTTTTTSPDKETQLSLPAHRDYVMTNVIVQHEVEGLEVQMKDGSWFAVPPEPDACVVVAGDLLTVVTNGRVQACLHRVRTPSNRERFATLLGCMPTNGCMVRAIDELVDQDHPLMYHPCDPYEYSNFQYTEEGSKSKDALKAFCGVAKEDEPVVA